MLIRRQVLRDCIFGRQIGTATQAQLTPEIKSLQ